MRTPLPTLFLASLTLLTACWGGLDAGSNGTDGLPIGTAGSAGTTNGGSSGVAGETAAGQGGTGGLAGAGGTTSPGGSDGQGGSASPGQGGTAGSGAASGGGTAGSGGTGSRKKGYLEFGTRAYDPTFEEGPNLYLIDPTAYFHDAHDLHDDLYGSPASCTIEQYGDCRVKSCVSNQIPATLNAGTITFTGGTLSPQVTTVIQDQYNSLLAPRDAPNVLGGELVQVTASGGQVPAFSLSGQIPIPPRVDGLPVGASPMIDTNQDIYLTISGGDATTLDVVFGTIIDQQGAYRILQCTVPTSSTSLTIPATGLAKLRQLSTQGAYHARTFSSVTTQAGDWDIKLDMFSLIVDASGAPRYSQSQVTFQ
ncbi:MAG: hypothetical protein EOO74_05225 [Myxococcales bacterium]|nr:MAG: hypothetical protein EOO74_05225 [Myxococcales bacterium]